MKVGGKTEGSKFFSDLFRKKTTPKYFCYNIILTSLYQPRIPTEAPEDFNTPVHLRYWRE